jgi:hypothetical protein
MFDCKKEYLLIMLQVACKGKFLFGHLNNAKKCWFMCGLMQCQWGYTVEQQVEVQI